MPTESITEALRVLIRLGLTSPLAIGVATGIEAGEINLILLANIQPANEQQNMLASLYENYKLAITLVNAETARQRFAKLSF